MVVDFVTRFVREVNIREINEDWALADLPSLLREFAKSQQMAGAEMVSPKEGSLAGWPKSVKYHPRNYA